jgi:hypothetical protein
MFKGSLTQNILPLFFSTKHVPKPDSYPKACSEYKFEFAEIFEFAIDPLCGPPLWAGLAFFFKLEQIKP